MVLVPLITSTMIGSVTIREKLNAENALHKAVESAKTSYRTRLGLTSKRSWNTRVVEESRKKLREIAKKKREVRLRLAAVHTEIQAMRNDASSLVADQERTRRLFQEELDRFLEFTRALQTRQVASTSTGPAIGGGIVRRFMRGSLGDRVAINLRDHALLAAREQLILDLRQAEDTSELSFERLHTAAGEKAVELVDLETEHRKLQKEYLAMLDTLDSAKQTVDLSESQIQQIKDIVADVHEQVLKLQGELARIDARLQAKAERDLIEKGLRAPRPGSRSDGRIRSAQVFSWPAFGPISAGFHNERYHAFFGVPHEGIDIVIPQSSTVYAAAEGIVFLVRDGGQDGYTYVLIGHRDGYATLYGHLSAVTVEAGDELYKGEAIGLSGGTPGTHGAGPMTTGAHLHFEVIHRGVHIDPREVLP